MIKESRFSTVDGWYAPSDDLVADDAAAGGAVTSIGWWSDIEKTIWEVSTLDMIPLG